MEIFKPVFRVSAQRPRRSMATVARWALLMIALVVIFVADTVTSYEIAVAVFHVVVVLIAAGFLPTLGVLIVSFVCMVLTMVSVVLTQHGAYEAGVINGILSICAIGVTTYLALQRSSAVVAEHEARAQLTRLARVNALGEMAASIAHEVNQPLTGIVTSGGACRNWLASEPPNLIKAQQAVERMVADANRASDIVARVRNLSKRAEPKAEWIDAGTLVSDVLALSRVEIDKAGVEVAFRKPAEALPAIFADAVQIQQVLLNLILNALEAMNGSPSGKRELTIDLAHLPEKLVAFTVTDTGQGCDPERVEQMFDAFYSTKADGIGMGLAISRSIVEAHGGRIGARPNVGGGMQFYFSLPSDAWGTA